MEVVSEMSVLFIFREILLI